MFCYCWRELIEIFLVEMSQKTNESEDGMMFKDQTDSPFVEGNHVGEDGMMFKDQTDSPFVEGNHLGTSGAVLKKGPWTSAEDTILIDYVQTHGEGNWNNVQKHSGLFRCGKSCRLRWANHLRPNLKKGAFNPDEERLIIELHSKMGNKWARMAAYLPGRTDNEIKNYWNTRIKRRQRAGLPLYPPEVCLQAMHEGEQSQHAGRIHGELRTDDHGLHDTASNGLEANNVPLPYAMDPCDLPGNRVLGPPYFPELELTSHSQKHFSDGFTPFDGTPDGNSSAQAIEFTFLCNSKPDPRSSLPFDGMDIHGSFSTSKPTSEALNLELPSFQNSATDFDSLMQSPPPVGDCSSHHNSGLLDALIHEAKTLGSGKKHSSEKSSNSSANTPGDAADSSNIDFSETEWEEYGDPISPLGQSVASIFSDKHLAGCNVNSEGVMEQVWYRDEGVSSWGWLDYWRPDSLPGEDPCTSGGAVTNFVGIESGAAAWNSASSCSRSNLQK